MTISGQLAGLYEYRSALESKIEELEGQLRELVGEPEEIPVPEEPAAPVLEIKAEAALPVEEKTDKTIDKTMVMAAGAGAPSIALAPTPVDNAPLTIAAAEGQVYSIVDPGSTAPVKRRGRPPGSKNKIN